MVREVKCQPLQYGQWYMRSDISSCDMLAWASASNAIFSDEKRRFDLHEFCGEKRICSIDLFRLGMVGNRG